MKTAQIKIFFLIFLATGLGFASANAQTTISGKVTDLAGEALPGSRVYLEDTYDGATTDTEGNFTFNTEEAGEFILKAEFMEYAPFAKGLLLDGRPHVVEIQLKEAFSEVKAVTISAGAFEASDRKQAVILSSLDMVTTAGTAGDVYGALQSLPGTSTVGESGRLFVRGGTAGETQTFIDGNLVYKPFSSTPPGMAVRGRFNPFMFKGTTFSTGGYSAEYGQAMSSVLLLETNELPAEDQVDIGILSVGGDVAATKTWEGGAVTGSVNYTNLAPYMRIIPQNFNWNKEPEAYGAQLNFRQKTGKSGMFKLYGNFNQSAMNLAQPDPEMGTGESEFDLKNGNLFLNSSWKTLLNDKWAVRAGASFTRDQDRIGVNDDRIQTTLNGLHSKSALTYSATNKIKLRFGGDFFLRDYAFSFQEGADSNGSNSFAGSFAEQRVSSFVEADVYASEQFVVRAGLRAEHSFYLGQTLVSPRLAAAWKLDDYSQFSLAYGWFFQDPEEDILLYSQKVRAERADHYLLNYQYHKNRRSFRGEIYFKDYKNLVTFTDAPFYEADGYENAGSGYAYGLDLFYRDQKTIKNGDYWISYSFVETKRQHRDFPELATPSFVSRHNLSVVYKHFITQWRSMPGATFTYGSPRRYNDPNSSEFNAEKMSAFLSLDLNWSYLYRENIIFHAAVSNVPGFKQGFGQRFASQPDANGQFASTPILPAARRFIVLGCFITLSGNGNNQLDKIN